MQLICFGLYNAQRLANRGSRKISDLQHQQYYYRTKRKSCMECFHKLPYGLHGVAALAIRPLHDSIPGTWFPMERYVPWCTSSCRRRCCCCFCCFYGNNCCCVAVIPAPIRRFASYFTTLANKVRPVTMCQCVDDLPSILGPATD